MFIQVYGYSIGCSCSLVVDSGVNLITCVFKIQYCKSSIRMIITWGMSVSFLVGGKVWVRTKEYVDHMNLECLDCFICTVEWMFSSLPSPSSWNTVEYGVIKEREVGKNVKVLKNNQQIKRTNGRDTNRITGVNNTHYTDLITPTPKHCTLQFFFVFL